MTQKNYKNVTLEINKERAFLTINRPPLNILNIATMEEINDALRTLIDNKKVKVLVITGSGEKAFSAGVDVADHTEEKVEKMTTSSIISSATSPSSIRSQSLP